MTKVGWEYLKERISSINLYPPDGMGVQRLIDWFDGAEYLYQEVQKVIAEFEEDNTYD